MLNSLLTLGKLAELKCNRLEPTQVACELISSGLLGKNITPIPTLQRAEVVVNEDSEGNTTYDLALLTKNGKIPLTEMSSSGAEGNHEKANQINAFVSNPQQMSLSIHQDDRWFACLFGGIFALIGGVPIFYSLAWKRAWKPPTYCTFDKGSRRMYLKPNVFNSEVREQMLDEVKGVEVIEETDSDGYKTYSTRLVLNSGEQIPLVIYGSVAKKHKIVQSINQFLGVKS